MQPIAQTFVIPEPPPPSGVPGVFITRIDVYFQSVSSAFGIEMQIRTTLNGVPTANHLPHGKKNVLISDTYTDSQASMYSDISSGASVLQSSGDASAKTSFIFDTPVFVESQKSYAIVLMPHGGSPDYNVWTATVGGKDTITGNPVYAPPGTGDLFLSSNDIDWLPVLNEDMKYQVYIANFTSQSGSAHFTSSNEDWIVFKNPTGNFQVREPIMFASSFSNVNVLSVVSNNGTIVVGDTVYQNLGQANVTGIVYSSNTSYIKVSNIVGGVFGNGTIYDANSSANAVVNTQSNSYIFNNINYNTNTISVPDSSVYTNNTLIFAMSSTGSKTQVVNITGIPNGTTLNVNAAMQFTDPGSLIGPVYANGALNGNFSVSKTYDGSTYYGIIDNITSNFTYNLASANNYRMFGLASGVSANLVTIHNPAYNSITTQFTSVSPSNTSMNVTFTGFQNTAGYPVDSMPISITDGLINEMTDVERVIMSRSNEIAQLAPSRAGNSSLVVNYTMSTSNSKISPSIDLLRNNVTMTDNIICQGNELTGYYLTITDNKVVFPAGTVLTQNTYGFNSTGTVHIAPDLYNSNSTFLTLTNVNGAFLSNTAFTLANGYTGFAQTATSFSEAKTNGYIKSSRYISKNIILAAGQDSEDIQVYMGSYRPVNTDMLVFAKIQAAADNDQFNNKDWTQLQDSSTITLFSSSVNNNDLVELQYGFNTSINLFTGNCTSSNSSQYISVLSNAPFSNNTFIYLQDNNSNTFNVRQVLFVGNTTSTTNTTALFLDRYPSFTSSNVSVGVIPGIQSTSSAFNYDKNNGIVRYVTSGDSVYDSFIQFAIKIVPISTSTSLVPRASDLRVLALQI